LSISRGSAAAGALSCKDSNGQRLARPPHDADALRLV
jgi:hypothetical protein